ncbi:glycosyltransferase family 4 protein [Yersinia pekkanenii]|uniref:WbcM protein n=1 Tax=Yersinia pekkanenii TaxID=1288385 RepID=A0A0T9NIS6_9GAMM|nr:glycosyltransferase family 4 protein [Yersinia pekkanenii]CNH13162.1 WbcM protein [Yersinia pekkanenii]CRY65441.1 WbcM protein [Yersinia pekkanenii]
MHEYSNNFSPSSNKQIVIQILLGDISSKGGIERVSVSLANALSEYYDVEIISLYKASRDLYFKPSDKVKLHLLTEGYEESMYNRKKGLIKGILFDLQYINKKNKLLKKLNKNKSIIISCDTKMSLLAKLSGYKNIIAIEHFEYDVINPILKYIRKIIYRKISAVVTLTNEDADKYSWLPKNKHKIIPNIVEIPEKKIFESDKKNNVLAVGRFVEQKGFDLLLAAWAKIPTQDWSLTIVGDGPDKPLLEKFIKEKNLTNVYLEPFTDNIGKYYEQAKIFVLSSRYEGLGMVLIEALAYSLPCISFNCPAGPKTILNKDNGILVEAENTEQLSIAIKMLIDNETLRKKYSNNASSSINEYTKEQVLKLWFKTIEQTIT